MDDLTFLREKLRREVNEILGGIAVGDEPEEERGNKDTVTAVRLAALQLTTAKEFFEAVVPGSTKKDGE